MVTTLERKISMCPAPVTPPDTLAFRLFTLNTH
jgi:hypothetical protein